MKTRHPKNQDGFTLIELLVSLALVSMMAAYAFNLIGRFKDMRRIEAVAQQRDMLASAREHLRLTVGGTRTRFKRIDASQGEMVFRGTKDSLILSNTLDERVVFGELHNITYRLVDGTLTLDIGETIASTKPNVLLKHVNTLAFKYFGQLPTDDAVKWHDTWVAQTLPRLVRVEMTMDKASNLQWQPLDIALEVSSSAPPTN